MLKIKKYLLCIVALIAVCGLGLKLISSNALDKKMGEFSDATIEFNGFETADDAIKYCIACINKGDMDSLIKASFATQLAEYASFEKQADKIKSVRWYGCTILPTEYSLYKLFNIRQAEGDLLFEGLSLILSLTQPKYYSSVRDINSYEFQENERADYTGFDPTLQGDIKILRIDIPRKKLYESARVEKVREKRADRYGAEAIGERVVLYEYDGSYYVGGFGFAVYGGRYYITNLTSFLLDQQRALLFKLANKEDYAKLLK